MRARTSAFLAGLLVAAASVSPSTARAESGRINLHVDIGGGVPFAGESRPSTGSRAGGAVGYLGADFTLVPALAIEALIGVGGFSNPFPGSLQDAVRYRTLSLGVRWRLFEDVSGYVTEGGRIHGNLWVSGHVGWHRFDGSQFGFDGGVGYELSIARPFSLGAFLRFTMLMGGDTSGPDAFFVAGLTFSVAFRGQQGPRDTDGDGLTDDDEEARGLNPNARDTDGDGIPDGVELTAGYDPLQSDSDHDGLSDGQEDADRDGQLDPGESSPIEGDTDGGGVNDFDERMRPGSDPQNPEDDGVEVPLPVHPEGPPSARQVEDVMEFEGIQFGSGSAEILEESVPALQEVLALLETNRDVRVEIGGHTDDRGSERVNRRLSQLRAQAVHDWLVAHGIDPARLEVRGYGSRNPIAPNDTAEGRAQNRRIELRRLR